MIEIPKPHSNRGGYRIAGPGKKIGRPRFLPPNMHRTTVYLDKETLTTLSSISSSISQAIRTLAANHPDSHLD